MGRRIALAGLAGLLAAPAFLIAPASAAIAFTCDSVTGSAVFSPGLGARQARPEPLQRADRARGTGRHHAGVHLRHGGQGQRQQRRSPSLSADGTKVAFASEATNLDPADTDTHLRRLREGPDHRRPHAGLDLRHRGQGQRRSSSIRRRCRPTAPGSPSCPRPPTSTPPTPTPRRRLREGPHHRRPHAGLDLRHRGQGQRGQRRSVAVGRRHAGWRSSPAPPTSTPPTPTRRTTST